MAKKEAVVASSIVRKEFGFSKENVNLNFTLRIDNSSELRIFSELLTKAKEAVDAEIATLKN